MNATACTNPAPVIPLTEPPTPAETKPEQDVDLQEAAERTREDLESKRAELGTIGRRLAERALRVALGQQEADPQADQADQLQASTLRAVIGPQEAALREIERRLGAKQRAVEAAAVADQVAAFKRADQAEQDVHRATYAVIQQFDDALSAIVDAKKAARRERDKLTAMQEQGLITLDQLSDATHRPTQLTPDWVSSTDRFGRLKAGFERTEEQRIEGLRELLDRVLGEIATGAQEAPMFVYRWRLLQQALANFGGEDVAATDQAANDRANEALIGQAV
jgi:hypothetical protein